MRAARATAVVILFVCAGAATRAHERSLRDEVRLTPVLGLDEVMPIPEDNLITRAKVELGRDLFFDARLSADGTISCASCHRPEHGFGADGARSAGVHSRTGSRNAPALINRGYGTSFGWDGAQTTLELQMLRPFLDPLEMDVRPVTLVARLRADRAYRTAFQVAFDDGVTDRNVARALAGYVRTIRSGNAPIDRFRAGDVHALSEQARRGAALFTGRANCAACHRGPNFTDEAFHNTGAAVRSGDPGRFTITGRSTDSGAFRTPTLREVARTAPYMHDGSLATLEEVLDFYDAGGVPNIALSPELRPLGLTPAEKQELLAFLRSLAADSLTCAPFPCR